MNDELLKQRIEDQKDKLGLAHYLSLVADVCWSKCAEAESKLKPDAKFWEEAAFLVTGALNKVNV